jgi:hypothetical protein
MSRLVMPVRPGTHSARRSQPRPGARGHDLLDYAEAAGLDLGRFTEDLEPGTHIPNVNNDVASGVRSGVNDALVGPHELGR